MGNEEAVEEGFDPSQPMIIIQPVGEANVQFGWQGEFALPEVALMMELALQQVKLAQARAALRQFREQKARAATGLWRPGQ